MNPYLKFTAVIMMFIVMTATTTTSAKALALHINMPPLGPTDSTIITTSLFHHQNNYGAKKNHPTTYNESPSFKGPLILTRNQNATTKTKSSTTSTSNLHVRVGHYYRNTLNQTVIPKTTTSMLKPGMSTKVMLQMIVDHLAFRDAPVDIKEVAESMEFYLQIRKRLLKAAVTSTTDSHKSLKKEHKKKLTVKSNNDRDDEERETNDVHDDDHKKIVVIDACCGHGLTGMLFGICHPHTAIMLVDRTEPPSHQILLEYLQEICPWTIDISFHAVPIDEIPFLLQQQPLNKKNFVARTASTATLPSYTSVIMIATHACGKLTDQVLDIGMKIRHQNGYEDDDDNCNGHNSKTAAPSSLSTPRGSHIITCDAIAVMPCCYTGTTITSNTASQEEEELRVVPYGIQRALGIAWAADIARSYALQEAGYHVDLATIPSDITPMNRIIIGTRRRGKK